VRPHISMHGHSINRSNRSIYTTTTRALGQHTKPAPLPHPRLISGGNCLVIFSHIWLVKKEGAKMGGLRVRMTRQNRAGLYFYRRGSFWSREEKKKRSLT
jgi:hypothetical protein